MVSTATSDQPCRQGPVTETGKYPHSKDPRINIPSTTNSKSKEPKELDPTFSKNILDPEKLGSRDEEIDLFSEETESNRMSSDSSSLSNEGSTLEEVKIVEHIVEKKIKRKVYWYGNHKLVKPIKEIPPRFQLLLAETNAEKVRCEGRPIILQPDAGNPTNEVTTRSTAFNPEAKCFVPNQPLTAKISSSETLYPPEGKDAPVLNTNNEMLTSAPNSTMRFSPAPPIYTIHIYGNGPNPTSSTGVPSPVTNPCCMHLSNTPSSMCASDNTTAQAPIQGPSMYYPSQPYSPQTYPAMQYPPGFLTPSVPQSSITYAPCFAYSQNIHYSMTALP